MAIETIGENVPSVVSALARAFGASRRRDLANGKAGALLF